MPSVISANKPRVSRYCCIQCPSALTAVRGWQAAKACSANRVSTACVEAVQHGRPVLGCYRCRRVRSGGKRAYLSTALIEVTARARPVNRSSGAAVADWGTGLCQLQTDSGRFYLAA
jgi:hypothetical protein